MISLAHRTVFVHVPKCGGQSVEAAFCAHLGLDWDRHRRLLLMMPRPQGWQGQHGRLAHLTAWEYVAHDYLPAALWDDFFTFGVVRNPFARMESAWRYLKPTHDFPDFVSGICEGRLSWDGFLNPASEYLSDPDGTPMTTAVYRLEELSARWPEIAARAGLGDTPLPHRNAEAAPRPRLHWSDRMIEDMQDRYAEDFHRYGYDPDTPPG